MIPPSQTHKLTKSSLESTMQMSCSELFDFSVFDCVALLRIAIIQRLFYSIILVVNRKARTRKTQSNCFVRLECIDQSVINPDHQAIRYTIIDSYIHHFIDEFSVLGAKSSKQ
uniref:F-box domain-containing protein n=1 Tax=Caenorhabditis tropicalis TaxID=1561998 RepID=A0A1I7U5Z0_9PELO